MDAPLNLTFGVEFEFVVRFKREKYEPYMSASNGRLWHTAEYMVLSKQQKLDIMVRAHVIAALSKYGFLVNTYQSVGTLEKGYKKWGVVSDASIDASLESSDPRWVNCGFTGVELRTPAFYLCSQAIKQIEQVLNVLTLRFDVFVNQSCGLHVHVGNGHKGFPVRTVKNLCLLVTGFERQLNALHPLHRIQTLYAKPPGRALPLASPWEKLLAIDALNNIRDIVQHFNPFDETDDCAMAYNLGNLHYTDKNTIEFRQHAATLEPMAVIKWVETVTGLVSLSHETPYPAFVDLIQEHIDDSRFSVVDLLHALNLHVVADYFKLRGIWTHPQQEWDWVDPLIAERKAMEGQTEEERGQNKPDKEVLANTNPSTLAAAIADVAEIDGINNGVGIEDAGGGPSK